MDYEIRDLERALAKAPDDRAAQTRYAQALAREGRRPMLLMTDFMVNEDKPGGQVEGHWRSGWSAGSQLAALRFYLDESKVEIPFDWQEQDYQGECLALLKVNRPGDLIPVYVIWRDSFGSCGGCDSLEDNNGYDYIKATLAEGNTRQFWSVQEAVDYLKTTEDYWWEKAKGNLVPELEKLITA